MMLAKINISPSSLSVIAFGVTLLFNLVGARSSKGQVAASVE